MHYDSELLNRELVHTIDTDLKRFVREWKIDPTIGTMEPIAAFCDVLLRGGKRLRGVLAIKSYLAFGGKDESVAIGAARVFEIIQTSLLIVDDIADRSKLRRGGPSAYAMLESQAATDHMKGSPLHYGEVQAMNVAYAGVHKAALELLLLGTNAETVRRACSRFHQNILVTVNGQIDDIYNEATPELVGRAEIESVLERKSAYYSILSPIELGAQLAGLVELPKALRTYSIHAGCAYQIADDNISTFGFEDETGKGSNDDIREGKLTLLTHYALDHASSQQKEVLENTLGNEKATAKACDDVRAILREIGSLEYAQKRLTYHKTAALAALKTASGEVPESFLTYLRQLTEYLVDRNA